MTDMFLERSFEVPLSPADCLAMVMETGWCFEMHNVEWHGSLLRLDGRRLLCRFRAADAESVRLAFGKTGGTAERFWPGTTHDAPQPPRANVLVERSFEEPVALEDIQALEDAHQWCLDSRNVKFVRTFFSNDRKRMICLYAAPDAESVREAQREAGLPLDQVWAFQPILPDALTA